MREIKILERREDEKTVLGFALAEERVPFAFRFALVLRRATPVLIPPLALSLCFSFSFRRGDSLALLCHNIFA